MVMDDGEVEVLCRHQVNCIWVCRVYLTKGKVQSFFVMLEDGIEWWM